MPTGTIVPIDNAVVIDTIDNPFSETSKQLSCPLLLWRHSSLTTVIRSGESKSRRARLEAVFAISQVARGDLIQTTKSPITISVLRMIRVSKPSCTGSTSRVFRVNHSWLVSAVGIGGNNNASGPGGLLPAPTLLSSTLGQYWTAIFVVDFIN